MGRQSVCIRCSATGGGNVSGVHRRQSRQAPSRVWAVEATLACCSGTTQDCTGCTRIIVSKPIHPAAGARHFTHHHCHPRAFLFHSQTAKDISSVVNGRSTADIIGADPRRPYMSKRRQSNLSVVDKFALTRPHKLNFLRYVVMFLSCCLFLYIEVFACYEL